MSSVKRCIGCAIEKPIDSFYRNSSGTGHRGKCKDCLRQQSATWRANNRERHNANARRNRNTRWARLHHVQRTFGLTPEQYESMEETQQHACAITSCRRPFSSLKRAPHVDHCHATGQVRGLLCHQCNQALGNARDNIAVLHGLIEYLERAA